MPDTTEGTAQDVDALVATAHLGLTDDIFSDEFGNASTAITTLAAIARNNVTSPSADGVNTSPEAALARKGQEVQQSATSAADSVPQQAALTIANERVKELEERVWACEHVGIVGMEARAETAETVLEGIIAQVAAVPWQATVSEANVNSDDHRWNIHLWRDGVSVDVWLPRSTEPAALTAFLAAARTTEEG